MQSLKPQELSNIRQLKKEGKFKQALEVINGLEDKKDMSVQDQFEIHHLKSSLLSELGYMNEALKYVELAYKQSKQLKNKFQIIDVLLTKSYILVMNDKQNEALEDIIKAEQILKTITQTSSIEFKEKNASLMKAKSGYYFNIGELNRSLKYAADGLIIAKEIENKRLMMLANKSLSFNYSLKGDLDRSFDYSKHYLSLAKELDDKQEIIGALNGIGIYFTDKGDFDQALDYLQRSLSLCDEIHSFKTTIVLSSLFELYFYTNSLEKAQKCLDRMKEFIQSNTEFKTSHKFYHLAKAIMLKKKSQKISHLKAKEILKQIIDKENPFSEIYYESLIHLSDIYLTILSETNDLKTLDEIQPYLTQLKFIAKSQKSFWLLVEVYSLQAKLKLITFEFKEAQRILSQALDIAKNYGLNLLAERISMEQDKLVNEKSKWEALRKSKALMAERIELAHLNDQIIRMLRKRVYLKKSTE